MRNYIVILTLFALTLSFNKVSARVYSTCPYPQHEVGIGYGYMSTEQFSIEFADIISNSIINSFTGSDIKTRSYQFIGPISIYYKYFFKEKLSIGGSFLVSSNKINYEDKNNLSYSARLNTFSILPRLDFYYIRNPKFALYGNIGVGAVLMTSRYKNKTDYNATGAAFAFQVTPIAMRIGREFGLVVELGIGSHGLANAGFSYRHYDRPWGIK
ncbi:MAG TPA: hypothetical protein VLZ75_00355 [Chitinophagales bacterium]|nr:hypothetical protein [Chitinophagales bacterium]